MTRRLVVPLVALSLLAPAAAQARPQTTIADRDGDNRLEPAPGEDYIVRDELGIAAPDRARTREEKVFFGQLTDIHVIDEESPLQPRRADPGQPAARSRLRADRHGLREGPQLAGQHAAGRARRPRLRHRPARAGRPAPPAAAQERVDPGAL